MGASGKSERDGGFSVAHIYLEDLFLRKNRVVEVGCECPRITYTYRVEEATANRWTNDFIN